MTTLKITDLNVLQNAKKEDLITDPFPFIVIKDCLPENVYQELSKRYPSRQTMFQHDEKGHKTIQNNTRYQISAHKALTDPNIDPLWKAFVQYHCSPHFYQQIVELFGDEIIKRFPHLIQETGQHPKDWNVGMRWNDNKSPMVTDCQIGINSPVHETTSVKGPHCDNKVELYAALLYMRLPEDDSVGGSLEIYRHPDGNFKMFNHPQWGKNTIEDPKLEKIMEVPYDKNVLVLFLNSRDSIHGVSPREPTQHDRRLVNIIGEIRNLKQGLWKK